MGRDAESEDEAADSALIGWRNIFLSLSPVNRALLLIVGVMAVFMLLLEVCFLNLPPGESLFSFFFFYENLLTAAVVVALVSLYKIVKGEPPEPFWRQAGKRLSSFILLYIIISFFCAVKSQIPYLNSYFLDPYLITADRFLGGGRLPQEWLGFLYDSPHAIFWTDHIYESWFFVIYIYVFSYLFISRNETARFRIIIPFALVWFLLGNIAAIIFSSVGPIFVTDYYPQTTSPYAPYVAKMVQMKQDGVSLFGIHFRDMLLGFRNDGVQVDINAPSAVPSVHIAMAALIALHCRRYTPRLFFFALFYLGVMLCGSVILCWHYVAGNIIALILTYGVWRLGLYLSDVKLFRAEGKTISTSPSSV